MTTGLLLPLVERSDAVAPDSSHVLAEISYGSACLPTSPGRLAFGVPLPVLGGDREAECWLVGAPSRCGRLGAVRFAESESSMFGVASARCGIGDDLELAARSLYDEILQALEQTGQRWPWRIWNVLPAINRDDDGLERYRRFCRARAEAFEAAYGPDFATRLCAASAVGSADGGPAGDLLQVCVLAGREPGRQWENPLQVPAWRYPGHYGPRSPSFTRATSLPSSQGSLLMLSGTASIRGHQTVHEEALDAQLEETLVNLAALVNQAAGRRLDDPRWQGELLSLKVYLRRRSDLDAVAESLAASLPGVPTLYLEADICRRELLLEIEGVARPAGAGRD